MQIWRILCTLLLAAVGCQANFMLGDFVPTSRKAQFQGQRTQWIDVLGSHCPKFGVSRTIAMPIPEPTGFDSPDNYKLQLSFDGDRVITPWLQIIGRHAPEAPSLVIDLVRSGDALVSVSAKVEGLKPTDPHYTLIRKEFSSKETWPKHLTVHYRWQARHEVDTQKGLLVMFIAGAGAMLIAALSVAKTYNKQLKQFVDDVSGETRFVQTTSFVKAD